MSDRLAIILGVIIIVAILFFTSWNKSKMQTELAREKMTFESIEREKDRQLERQKIEHEREMLKRQRQSEEP